MKKNFVLGILVLVFSLAVVGCASTGSSSTGTTASNALSNVVGKWRSGGDSPTGFYAIMDIGSNGSGSFKLYQKGAMTGDMPVNVTRNGQFTIDNTNVQHTLTDVIVNGKYFGEQLSIKGFVDSDLIFYKTNPSQEISFAGTSWYLDSIDTSYVFKDDGTFEIDLGPQVQSIVTSMYSNSGTEGTYSIKGNEVTLTYPDGVRVVEFYRSDDGYVSMRLSRDQSLVIFIEGIDLVIKGAYFELVTE